MAISIISRTISSVVDQRISIANDQIGRTISIGSTWNSLRVAMRYSFVPSGTSGVAGPVLHIGLCSGTSNMAGHATTTNFFGYSLNNTSPANIIYGVGPPQYLLLPANYASKRVGSTWTDITNIVGNYGVYAMNEPTTKRGHFIFQVTKGSPNFTLDSISMGGNPSADGTTAQQNAALDAGTMTGAATALGSPYGNTSVTAAFSEGAGNLDTINIHWGSSAIPLEISEIRYARIS